MNTKPKVIFHCPFPVRADRTFSANVVRPYRLLQTFRRLGYDVTEITGYAADRHRQIVDVRRRIRQGESFDFAYAESSNLPLFFNEPDRVPRYPFADYSFFRLLKSNGVMTGVFYRDLYWISQSFHKYSLLKRLVGKPFYWLDWMEGVRIMDHLFLPSIAMARFLPTPWPAGRFSALPPGCDLEILKNHGEAAATQKRSGEAPLRLFYVGGVTPPLYDLSPAFRLASERQAQLTVFCRADEWQEVRGYYSEYVGGDIEIVHDQGAALANIYRGADLFILALASFPYRDFAVPYKIFESVSYALPLLALGDSEATRIISREDFGWTTSTYQELSETLHHLSSNRDLIQQKRIALLETARRHSWENRVLAIQAALTRSPDAPQSP